MARVARQKQVNECRQCSTFCDRVIAPATCVAADCPALYQYDDPLTGRRYMGCLHKVFAHRDRRRAVRGGGAHARAATASVKLAGAPAASAARSRSSGRSTPGVRRLRQPPLLRLAGRRRRAPSGVRPARPSLTQDPRERSPSWGATEKDPRIRCRRPGHGPAAPLDPMDSDPPRQLRLRPGLRPGVRGAALHLQRARLLRARRAGRAQARLRRPRGSTAPSSRTS